MSLSVCFGPEIFCNFPIFFPEAQALKTSKELCMDIDRVVETYTKASQTTTTKPASVTVK